VIAKKEVETQEKSSAKLTITVGKDEVKKNYDELVQEYCKKIHVNGFRKGKVPPKILEKKYGESLKAEASGKIIEEAVKEAFDEIEEKPLPYSQPALEEEAIIDPDQDFAFSVIYDTFPEVKVGEYKGLEVEKPQVEVTKEELQQELEKIQDQNSIVVDKEEGKAEDGDIVTIDYAELDENEEEKADTRREDFSFTIGTEYNIYKIDEDVKGMEVGEEKTIEKTYSEDDDNKDLAGKTVKLKVKLKSMKQKDLPEIDDELAQDVSENYETLDDLKADITKRLEKEAEDKVRHQLFDELIGKIAENSEVELPESMVKAELENSWQRFAGQLQMPAEKIEQLLEGQGKAKDDMLEEWRPGVEENIKKRLFMDKIIEDEKIEVSDEDAENFMKEQAEQANLTFDQVKSYYENNQMMDYLKQDLATRKLTDFLIENAKVKKGKKVKLQDLKQDEGQ